MVQTAVHMFRHPHTDCTSADVFLYLWEQWGEKSHKLHLSALVFRLFSLLYFLVSHPIKSLSLCVSLGAFMSHQTSLLRLFHLSFPLYVTPLSSLPPLFCHLPLFSLCSSLTSSHSILMYCSPFCLSNCNYHILPSFSILYLFLLYSSGGSWNIHTASICLGFFQQVFPIHLSHYMNPCDAHSHGLT